MKFIVVLALVALFAFAVAEEEKEKEDVEVHDEEEEGRENEAVDSAVPSALSSAMQFKGNNIGDINTLKVNFDGELNNVISQDILNIMVALLNQQKIIENHGTEADDDDDDVEDGDKDKDEEKDEDEDKDEKKDDDDKEE